MHPIIYRSRPTHSGIACAAAFAAITSCAPGAPHMSTVQATERPYLAVNELEMRTTPEARLVGSFVERNKCIPFITLWRDSRFSSNLSSRNDSYRPIW